MNKRTCSMPDCGRAYRARGLCGTHYNQVHVKDRHKKKPVPCAWCGTEVLRSGGGGRKYGASCSEQCRQWLATPYCKLPEDHWVRWYGKTSPWKPKVEKRVATLRTIECAWCGAEHQTYQSAIRYCGRTCARRAGKMRRRGRETSAAGEYSWAQVMRLHHLAGRRCSYCDQHVAQPEPDHVVPISRGGRNDIGNILPCCRLCNADKGDMSLTEWADDRARRGKPAVRTVFDWRDKRFTHLVPGEATGQSHRILSEPKRAA